jgi:hypothetical protein
MHIGKELGFNYAVDVLSVLYTFNIEQTWYLLGKDMAHILILKTLIKKWSDLMFSYHFIQGCLTNPH